MIVTTHERLSDEELLRECDKQFGNPLIVELKKRLESHIDSQQSYEAEISNLETKVETLEAAALDAEEKAAEQSEEISSLQEEVASLKEALDLLA